MSVKSKAPRNYSSSKVAKECLKTTKSVHIEGKRPHSGSKKETKGTITFSLNPEKFGAEKAASPRRNRSLLSLSFLFLLLPALWPFAVSSKAKLHTFDLASIRRDNRIHFLTGVCALARVHTLDTRSITQPSSGQHEF